jgi:hypothetical protein
MAKREDGSLVVKRSDEAIEGVFIQLNVDKADESSISITDCRVRIARVTGRQPIEDVPFDVGRPIITTLETSTSLRLRPGNEVVLQWPGPTENDPPIFVFLSAKLAEQE